MVTSSYLREKLINAQYALACHPGVIKERLEAAFFSFAPIETREVDERYRCAFGEIRDALLVTGNVQTTLEAMDEVDARKIAERIVDLSYTLQRDRPPSCC